MISCSGCNIQASNVADHLDMMATIAIRNMGNCETMSDALNAYLDEHGDAIQKSARSIVSAHVEDVRGMFQSTTRIDMAIEHCPPTTMHRFGDMTFCNAANRRITAHLRNAVDVERHEQDAKPHPCQRARGFASRMTTADDDGIVDNGIIHCFLGSSKRISAIR